jgi:hypothetical protein
MVIDTLTKLPIEHYPAPDEGETESCILLDPYLFSGGRVKSEKTGGRFGVRYRDTKTGRFISREGLLKIVRGD